MTLISDDVRRMAEEPEAAMPDPPAPARHIIRPSYVIGFSPSPNQSLVGSIRTSARELDALIAEVRGFVREAGYTRTVWKIGPSARPEGLAAALRARGFFAPTEPPFEPELTGMALVRPPPAPPPGIEARSVRDFDEYLATMRIAVTMMGQGDASEATGWLAAARALWDDATGIAQLTQIALIDGQAVGFGWAVACRAGLMLSGSGVRPEWRGRGAYRALVAARWSLAVSLGTPALAVQAGAMSRPVLERCGFEALCHVDVLEDPEIAGGSARQ
jgi:GNAT superfamily N-acetyltransferase